MLDAFVLQLQLTQKLGMMNEEGITGVRHLRMGHELQQPLRRFEFFRVMPKFPTGNDFERKVAGAAYLQERIARYRIERLDASIEKNGKPAEFADMVFAIFLRQQDDDDLAREKRDEKPGDKFVNLFHAFLRFPAKPNKWIPN